ncbi:MAG: DUF1269 domain-containing protein [Actinobacteria bacterium]|nr:DUF1269 domain-containing protein [Actinomycetota bacterium]
MSMDRIGPVDVLVIEFPRGEVKSQGFATLLDLVERDIIHVLDLEFVRRDVDGGVELVDIAEAVADAPEDLGFLVGAASGLLDPDDVAFVGEVIEPGSLAGVLLFEHVWIMPMAEAIEAGGARIVTAAHVDPLDLLVALGHDDDSEGDNQ